MPASPYRELRHLTQLRDTFVSEMVGMKLRLKARLLVEGIAFPPPPAGRQWSVMVQTTRRPLACSGTVRGTLDQLLDSVACTEQQGVKTTKEIRRFCQSDSELSRCLARLRTIPGIGWIVARPLLARIGDWREMNTVRQRAVFLGLVPTEHSTGEHTTRGSITHPGDRRLRSTRIQAAWAAIRQDGERRDCYRSVCRTHPRHLASRVAIVAVARKLSTRIAAVLMHQRPSVVRAPVPSAPVTQEETPPQGTTRRQAEPGENNS